MTIYATCSVCSRPIGLTRGGHTIAAHRRFDGGKSRPCDGSGQAPRPKLTVGERLSQLRRDPLREALVELAAEYRIAGDEWAAVRLETVLAEHTRSR